MGYPFPPELARQVHEHMASGRYKSEDELLQAALQQLGDVQATSTDDDPEAINAILEGIADMKAGKGRTFEEFDAEFRAKWNIGDDA